MNFLAHLHLAEPTAAGWIGSLAPDLLRGPDLRHCDPALHEGIAQHRQIDRFTDTHPIFLRSRRRLAPCHGRFAGILVDVFYDHVLARDWAEHDARPLGAFLRQIHEALAAEAALMPPVMRCIIGRMRRQRWLESYATVTGVERVLVRMERRLSVRFGRTVALSPAIADLVRLNRELTGEFRAFYPRLQAHCAWMGEVS